MKKVLIVLSFLLAGASFAQVGEAPPEVLEGRGEYEMVLIHGLGANDEIWDSTIPFLAATFKVWTFELCGHGETQPYADPSIAKEAIRLREFIEAEGIAYPTLVGHGLGGMIALQYSLDHPADVHRLIMIDSAPKQLATQEQKAEVAQALVENYDQFVFNRYSSMSPERDITEIVVDMALRTHKLSFISLLMSSFDFDVTDRMPDLTVPMLVVGSELLFPNPEQSTQILHQIGFSNARSLAFKRMGMTGHYVMLERGTYTASVLLAFGVDTGHDFGYE
jgi:pimeloyl-ACP methyl ester carboxylesterase